jgi:RNA polymerase sigma-70 factor (ECF subfamily)
MAVCLGYCFGKKEKMDNKSNKLFLKLLLENQSRIHAYILSLVPNYADAEDILQTVSELMWSRFDQFEPGTNFLGWALRYAHFEVLAFRKKKAKLKEVVFDTPVFEQMLPVITDELSSMDYRKGALEDCLDKLSVRHREIIKMRYSQDLSPKEIGRQFGLTIHGIYKLLSRVQGKLLECIERVGRKESLSHG